MTWEWVCLILGTILLIIALLGYIAWTQMRLQMFKTLPTSLPVEMLRAIKDEEIAKASTEIKEPDGRT